MCGVCLKIVSLHLRPDIMSLFDKSEIVCVQETWYAYQNLDILHNIHSSRPANMRNFTYDGMVC